MRHSSLRLSTVFQKLSVVCTAAVVFFVQACSASVLALAEQEIPVTVPQEKLRSYIQYAALSHELRNDKKLPKGMTEERAGRLLDAYVEDKQNDARQFEYLKKERNEDKRLIEGRKSESRKHKKDHRIQTPSKPADFSYGEENISLKKQVISAFRTRKGESTPLIEKLLREGNKKKRIPIQFEDESFAKKKKTPQLSAQEVEPTTTVRLPSHRGTSQVEQSAITLRDDQLPTKEHLQAEDQNSDHNALITEVVKEVQYNSVEIQKWISKEITYTPYYGVVQGASGCLVTKFCNDADTALLTSALLRASGIATRYTSGMIVADTASLQRMIGVNSTKEVVRALTQGGYPVALPGDGNSTLNLDSPDLEQVGFLLLPWVSVDGFIPYGIEKGNLSMDMTILSAQDTAALRAFYRKDRNYQWIPIDFLYHPVHVSEVPSFLMPMASHDFVLEQIKTGTGSPIEQWMQRFKTISGGDESLHAQKINPEGISFDFLPTSRPYVYVDILNGPSTAKSLTLASSLYREVTIRIKDANDTTPLLEQTLKTKDVDNRDVYLTYTGKTAVDKQMITTYGGVGFTPPQQVSIVPLLTIQDGGEQGSAVPTTVQALPQYVANTTHQLHPGMPVVIQFEVKQSGRVLVTNETLTTAGNTDGMVLSFIRTSLNNHPRDNGEILMKGNVAIAREYLLRLQDVRDRLSALFHVGVAPVFTRAVVAEQRTTDPDPLTGKPRVFFYKGQKIDVASRWNDYARQGALSTARNDLRMLYGVQASYEESAVLSDIVGFETFSTVTGLRYAQTTPATVPVVLTGSTSATTAQVDSFTLPTTVKNAIKDALQTGSTVITPPSIFSKDAWSGVVYLILRPDGTAHYAIGSDQQGNGGETVDNVDIEVDCPEGESCTIRAENDDIYAFLQGESIGDISIDFLKSATGYNQVEAIVKQLPTEQAVKQYVYVAQKQYTPGYAPLDTVAYRSGEQLKCNLGNQGNFVALMYTVYSSENNTALPEEQRWSMHKHGMPCFKPIAMKGDMSLSPYIFAERGTKFYGNGFNYWISEDEVKTILLEHAQQLPLLRSIFEDQQSWKNNNPPAPSTFRFSPLLGTYVMNMQKEDYGLRQNTAAVYYNPKGPINVQGKITKGKGATVFGPTLRTLSSSYYRNNFYKTCQFEGQGSLCNDRYLVIAQMGYPLEDMNFAPSTPFHETYVPGRDAITGIDRPFSINGVQYFQNGRIYHSNIVDGGLHGDRLVYLRGVFLDFYVKNGGEQKLGYPISNPYILDTFLIQELEGEVQMVYDGQLVRLEKNIKYNCKLFAGGKSLDPIIPMGHGFFDGGMVTVGDYVDPYVNLLKMIQKGGTILFTTPGEIAGLVVKIVGIDWKEYGWNLIAGLIKENFNDLDRIYTEFTDFEHNYCVERSVYLIGTAIPVLGAYFLPGGKQLKTVASVEKVLSFSHYFINVKAAIDSKVRKLISAAASPRLIARINEQKQTMYKILAMFKRGGMEDRIEKFTELIAKRLDDEQFGSGALIHILVGDFDPVNGKRQFKSGLHKQDYFKRAFFEDEGLRVKNPDLGRFGSSEWLDKRSITENQFDELLQMSKKENGVVGLEIMGQGGTSSPKTLFPDYWNDDDVVSLGEYISKAPNNLSASNNEFVLDYLDKTGRSMQIKGYFESGTKNITTFYPTYAK